MTNPVVNLSNQIGHGLACAALSPGLRSILIFDFSPAVIRTVAGLLAQMLEITTQKPVEQIALGTTESDDDLWGNLMLHGDIDAPIAWQTGTLAAKSEDSHMRLVLIPDLTQISLAAARASVMLMDTDVAHLERHGRRQLWHPNVCWLAGCGRDRVGQISPHLLDRFALRLDGRSVRSGNRVTEILTALDRESGGRAAHTSLSEEFVAWLSVAMQRWPTLTEEAKARILEYISDLSVYSPRREIALMRVAHTLARLVGNERVMPAHVMAAARLIWLETAPQHQLPDSWPAIDETEETLPQESLSSLADEGTRTSVSREGEEPVYVSDQMEAFPSIMITPHPYPEDQAQVEREATSLRAVVPRYRPTTANGPVVGVERATGMHDLALVSTLVESAKFQRLRRRYHQTTDNRLLITPSDLRSYRRAAVAEQMLVLLLDYTSIRHCDWHQALLPHLTWAYTERASICIVQVGVAGASHELRSNQVTAQNILVPRIGEALEAGRGTATPLAHGFDLALHTLRHALQHGRGVVQRALFVVISDGRGNVPLDASRAGRVSQAVNREGIDDTLQVAHRISGINGVQSVLLNPQPQQYTELPLALAAALGAIVVPIPALTSTEVV